MSLSSSTCKSPAIALGRGVSESLRSRLNFIGDGGGVFVTEVAIVNAERGNNKDKDKDIGASTVALSRLV